MKKFPLSTPLYLMILVALFAGKTVAQEDAMYACHIRAALVNSGESVYWADLGPCNTALSDVGRASLSRDEYFATLMNRAILLMELTELDRAAADLEMASQIDPLSANLQINLGLLNFLYANYSEAATQFGMAAESEELRATALFNRALAYGYLQDFEQALQDLLVLRSEYPQDYSAWVESATSEVFPELLLQLSSIPELIDFQSDILPPSP